MDRLPESCNNTNMEKLNFLIDYKDIDVIISNAKTSYIRTNLPMFISGKKIPQDEVGNILLMESFLSFLNSKGLLSSEVKFNKD